MNRRGFLKAAIAAAAGLAVSSVVPVDLDKLLWKPGQKTHFTPPPGGWKNPDVGISIRMIRQFQIEKNKFESMRLDVLYGYAVLRPELACRISA